MRVRRWVSFGVALGSVVIAMFVGSERSRAQDEAAPRPGTYVGSKVCKKCHTEHFPSWEQTRMGQAFKLLAPGERVEAKQAAKLDPTEDYRTHPECVRCHSVGFDQPGGFRLAGYDVGKDRQRLLDVGCEMCHGPGGGYADLPGLMDVDYGTMKEQRRPQLLTNGLVAVPTEETCRRCHNAESPMYREFNFAERAKAGVHGHFKTVIPQ